MSPEVSLLAYKTALSFCRRCPRRRGPPCCSVAICRVLSSDQATACPNPQIWVSHRNSPKISKPPRSCIARQVPVHRSTISADDCRVRWSDSCDRAMCAIDCSSPSLRTALFYTQAIRISYPLSMGRDIIKLQATNDQRLFASRTCNPRPCPIWFLD